jgi:hypothetical protein
MHNTSFAAHELKHITCIFYKPLIVLIDNSLPRKPTGPKTEASEFEVVPVKIENQEVRLAFGFYKTFYDILEGACKNHWGPVNSENPLVSYWPASLKSFRDDCDKKKLYINSVKLNFDCGTSSKLVPKLNEKWIDINDTLYIISTRQQYFTHCKQDS